MYCILKHLDKCGLEHLGEILECRSRLARMPEFGIHRPHHKVVIAGVQHIIQAYMAQKQSLIMLFQCGFNGTQRILRRLRIDAEIPEKPCKHQQNAEQRRTRDL